MAAAAGRTLRVALVANTTGFRKGMMSAVRDAQGFQGKMTALGASVGRFAGPMMAGAAAAVGAFAIKLGVDGVQAAIEEEKALTQLNTALNNVGQGFANAQVNQFIDDLQYASSVADGDLRPAFTRLVTATRDAAQAQDLLTLALDISAGTGKDLESVTMALSKAAIGQTTALRRLGVPLDAATLKSGDLNAISAELSKTFGGQAAASANTFAGKLKLLQISASELQESFGTGVIDALRGSAGSADDLAQKMRDLQDEARNLGTQVGNVINVALDAAKAFGEAKDWIDQTKSSGGALGTVVGALAQSFNQLLNPVGSFIDQAKILSAWLTGNDQALAEALGGAADAATTAAPSFGVVTQAITDAGDEADKAAQEFDLLTAALNRTEAAMAYQAAMDELRKSIDDNGKVISIFTNKGRENADALLNMVKATQTSIEATDDQAQKALYANQTLDVLTDTMNRTKMDPGTQAALLQPFQALLDDLRENGINVDSLQRKLDALQSKNITVTTTYVTLGDGSYYGSGDAAGGSTDSGGGGGKKTRTATRSAAVTIGTLNVTSAPGERAEESVPRSLRRLAFTVGLNG